MVLVGALFAWLDQERRVGHHLVPQEEDHKYLWRKITGTKGGWRPVSAEAFLSKISLSGHAPRHPRIETQRAWT